jgi:class 3 adenylate cyclase
MKFDIGKIVSIVSRHAGAAVKAVEIAGAVFGKGQQKKDAAITATIAGAAEGMAIIDTTMEERQLALIPEAKEAIAAVIEARVALMKAEKELHDVYDAVRAKIGK